MLAKSRLPVGFLILADWPAASCLVLHGGAGPAAVGAFLHKWCKIG